MSRMLAAALFLAAHVQEPVTAESRFRALLEKTEKAGLSVPELPDGAVELEKIFTRNLPRDLRDRYHVLRAQGAVLACLHAKLAGSKGASIEMPVAGKTALVKIVEVLKRTVKISRDEAVQEIAIPDLDPEWALATARPGFASEGDAGLWSGLWLAKAGRWDAAFLALSGVETDHPLANEARKRGLEAGVAAFHAAVKGKRWAEALAKLEALDAVAPGDDRLTDARDKLLDAMVEAGKDLCRKNSKGPMNEIIDFITKHFPDGADRIEDIREAKRWVKVTDPKKFQKLDAAKGPPWLLKPGDQALTLYSTEEDRYVGLLVKFRFEKDEKKAQAGFVWEQGKRLAWVTPETAQVCVGSGNPGESIEAYNHKIVSMQGPHTIVLRIREGAYVLEHNGVEFDRTDTKNRTIGPFALNVARGNVWVDDVQLLKKE